MTMRLGIIEFRVVYDKNGISEPARELRFKLLETFDTTDGLRTRVCYGIWKTLEEAQKEVRRRLELPEGQ